MDMHIAQDAPLTGIDVYSMPPAEGEAVLRRQLAAGHELGDHTVHHIDLRKASPAKIREEIAGSRAALEACGVPQAEIQGFRCPYLSDSPAYGLFVVASGRLTVRMANAVTKLA